MNPNAFLGGDDYDSSSGEDELAVVIDKSRILNRAPPPPPASVPAPVATEERPAKMARVAAPEPPVKFPWTKEADMLLDVSYRQFSGDWNQVAIHLSTRFGRPVIAGDCQMHWAQLMTAKQPVPHSQQAPVENCSFPISRLCQLFISYESNKHLESVVDWETIGAEMGVTGDQAIRQWLEISQRTARDICKSGNFHPDEDKLIVDFLAEWQRQGGGKGAYTALQKLLGRNDKRISERYRHRLRDSAADNSMPSYDDQVAYNNGVVGVRGNNNAHVVLSNGFAQVPGFASQPHMGGGMVGGGMMLSGSEGLMFHPGKGIDALPLQSKQQRASVNAATLTKWSPEMDQLLIDGYNQFQNNWAKVAAFVDLPNVTNEKCRKRMNVLLNRR